MKILLHICCGPCALLPASALREEGHELTGYFDNPNIQPLGEYLARREGAVLAAAQLELPLSLPVSASEYSISAWCEEALAAQKDGCRCAFCYGSRLRRAAQRAGQDGFPAFSTTLLYSRYQDHEGIKKAGEAAASEYGVTFLYRDFRPFWQKGIDAARTMGLYRQKYCGCIFSEEDRYARKLKEVTT